MTTKEIHDLIQASDSCGCDATGESATKNILNILEQMNNRLGEIEARLDRAHLPPTLQAALRRLDKGGA